MRSIGENCYWIEPKFVEDEDLAWNQVLETLDRWGDRKVPRTGPFWSHPDSF